MKQAKRLHILEVTDKDISIGFVYEDNTEEILIIELKAAMDIVRKLQEELDGTN